MMEDKATSLYYEMGLVSVGAAECGGNTTYTTYTKLNKVIVDWILQNTDEDLK